MINVGFPFMKLLRAADGQIYQAGIADGQAISTKKLETMKSLSRRRKKLTTPGEKKLCFAFQAMNWALGHTCPYQRERTIHIADIISRSLDFYFSQGKLGVEADGNSHYGEIQSAKDKWTDELLAKHASIRVMRFRNEQILNEVHSVIAAIAAMLCSRHSWPLMIRRRFDRVIEAAQSANSWHVLCTEYLDARNRR